MTVLRTWSGVKRDSIKFLHNVHVIRYTPVLQYTSQIQTDGGVAMSTLGLRKLLMRGFFALIKRIISCGDHRVGL